MKKHFKNLESLFELKLYHPKLHYDCAQYKNPVSRDTPSTSNDMVVILHQTNVPRYDFRYYGNE